MNDSETTRLSYAELAQRLGIKPHAARMKAKRAADRGQWRIIPGNHPNDRVLVELPTSALTPSARAEGHKATSHNPAQTGAHDHARAEAHDHAREAIASLATALSAAQTQISTLTARMTYTADAHRRDEVRLTSELAAAEAREMALEGEIVRLAAEARLLAEQLDRARLPWWRKL